MTEQVKREVEKLYKHILQKMPEVLCLNIYLSSGSFLSKRAEEKKQNWENRKKLKNATKITKAGLELMTNTWSPVEN